MKRLTGASIGLFLALGCGDVSIASDRSEPVYSERGEYRRDDGYRHHEYRRHHEHRRYDCYRYHEYRRHDRRHHDDYRNNEHRRDYRHTGWRGR